jgi:hypothetical protein
MDDTKKPALNLVKLPKRGIVHKRFRKMLRRRIKGNKEIAAGGFVIVYRNGSVGSGFIEGNHAFSLAGAVSMLQDRIHREVIDDLA